MSGDLDKGSSSPSSEYDDPTYVQEQPAFEAGHWQQQSQEHHDRMIHPAPAANRPFDHSSSTLQQEAALGVDHRLVPDLMQVYENMSVSKTPHSTRSSASALHGQPEAASRNAAASSHHHSSDYGSMQTSSYYSSDHPHQFSYGNFSIPAPYPIPYSISASSAVPQSSSETAPPSDAASSTASSTNERPRRKRSNGGSSTGSTKRRKKFGKDNDDDKEGKSQDGRWTKRFTWPDELHRDFVAAVFDIGLKHATPSSVMEHMPSHEQITTERIKSHLQKYRLHRHKSKEEFMSCYDDMVQRLKKNGVQGVACLSGAQAAGYVSYAVDTQPDPVTITDGATKVAKGSTIANPLSQSDGPNDGDTILTIPRLTEDEKNSALGMSLGYLLGLFFSLKRQLQETRRPVRHPYTDPPHDSSVLRQGSTSRNTLEAGSLMKREMESQMAFQNKMRALKQEELSKLAEIPASAEGAQKMPAFPEAHSPTETQHPGEADELRPAAKPRTTSEDEDFWNATNLDGELFDFLME
jgi:SHAQKYF class myb-like DNA-binding protein